MAVRIRLRRMGAKKKPFYRVVVADSRSPRDGRFLDTIGWYDPVSNPARLEIDADKAKRWLADGAEPTDSARSVLSQAGLIGKGGGPVGTRSEAAQAPAARETTPAAREPAPAAVAAPVMEEPAMEEAAPTAGAAEPATEAGEPGDQPEA